MNSRVYQKHQIKRSRRSTPINADGERGRALRLSAFVGLYPRLKIVSPDCSLRGTCAQFPQPPDRKIQRLLACRDCPVQLRRLHFVKDNTEARSRRESLLDQIPARDQPWWF